MKARIFSIVLIAASVGMADEFVRRPEFVLPDDLYAAPNLECNVYFAAVLDSVRPENYAFEVRAAVGRCENKRWTWTPKPADAGRSEQLVFNAWSDAGLACCRTVMVHVASADADPTRRVTCALMAASGTNCRYQDRLMAAMHEAGWKGYAPVGSRSGSSAAMPGMYKDGEAPHDGYGGYAADDFIYRYQISEEELANARDEAERKAMLRLLYKIPEGQEFRRALMKSPILKLENGKKVVDVQQWFDRINGGNAPDYILIMLGVNGTCQVRDEGLSAYCDKWQVAPMRELVGHLRAAAPATRICIATLYVGTDQDAFGKGYGCSVSAVQCHKNVHYLNRRWMALVKEFNDAGDRNVLLVPVSQALDPDHGYPVSSQKPFVHSSETVERKCNALHPTVEGGKQMGDAIAAWLMNQLGSN